MNKQQTEGEMDEIVQESTDLPVSIQSPRPPDTLGRYQDTIGIGDAVETESLRRKHARRTRLGERDGRPRSAAAKEAISYVGFCRFLSLSSDPEDELFCEGLTNELVKAMRSRGLRIAEIPIADQERTAFAGESEKLMLNAVLVGKLRKIGGRVRISVQLTNVFDGSVIWSEIYERRLENAVATQGEIARAIAQTIPICRTR